MGIAYDNAFTLVKVDLSDNTQVNAGADNAQTLQPSEGYIYQPVFMTYSAADPVGSTSGTHELQFNYDTNRIFAKIKSNTGAAVEMYYNNFIGDNSELPSGSEAQQLCVYNMYATKDQPITFNYSNDTDANQTGTRTLILICKKYRESV